MKKITEEEIQAIQAKTEKDLNMGVFRSLIGSIFELFRLLYALTGWSYYAVRNKLKKPK